jgi:hypothetical protein
MGEGLGIDRPGSRGLTERAWGVADNIAPGIDLRDFDPKVDEIQVQNGLRNTF